MYKKYLLFFILFFIMITYSLNVFAETDFENYTYNNDDQMGVVVQRLGDFIVIIPKEIQFKKNNNVIDYIIKAKGDIPSNNVLVIESDDKILVKKLNSNIKKTIKTNKSIIQFTYYDLINHTEKDTQNYIYERKDNNWYGILDYNIYIEGSKYN